MNTLKVIFTQVMGIITIVSSCWTYLWPFLFFLAALSVKYCGANNTFEQTVEAINKLETGIDVDISKEIEKSTEPHDLKKYIPSER